MKFLFWGVIVGTKGLNGTLKVEPEAHLPLANSTRVNIGFSPKYSKVYTLEKVKISSSRYNYLKLLEINSVAEAKELIEKGVFVRGDYIKNLDHEIFLDDFSGFEVIDSKSNKCIGYSKGKIENPGNDLILVETYNGDFFIPFVIEFIAKIDEKEKKIIVHTIPGLLDM